MPVNAGAAVSLAVPELWVPGMKPGMIPAGNHALIRAPVGSYSGFRLAVAAKRSPAISIS